MANGALALLLALFAQQAQDQERAQELERQKQLQDRIVPPEFDDEFFLDYGGWFRPQFYQFKDGTNRVRERHEYDARLWIDVRYGGIHTLYARGQFLAYFWDENDGPTGRDEKDQFRLDAAYYQLDVPTTNGLGAREALGFVRIGRLYTQVGTGIAFNGNFDGGMTGWELGPVSVVAFAGRSVLEQDDLDRSRTDPLETRRNFYSATIEGNFSRMVIPYAFVFIQRDDNKERPEVLIQEFRWNSEYWGVGARGNVIVPMVTFHVEYVRETGERYASLATVSTEHIDAWAYYADLGFRLLEHPMTPELHLTYMFATGDSDRFFVPNTFLGNAIATPDHTFTGFGYIPTGFLFNPLLANLHIWHVGGAFRPITPEELEVLTVEFGVDFYQYTKHRSQGGISDPTMKMRHHDVGWEIDVWTNIQVLSDLAFTFRYAFFKPGADPLEHGDRHFFLMAMIFSF